MRFPRSLLLTRMSRAAAQPLRPALHGEPCQTERSQRAIAATLMMAIMVTMMVMTATAMVAAVAATMTATIKSIHGIALPTVEPVTWYSPYQLPKTICFRPADVIAMETHSRSGPIGKFLRAENGPPEIADARGDEFCDCGFISGPPWVGTFSGIDGVGPMPGGATARAST
jgi:hypothetical protein